MRFAPLLLLLACTGKEADPATDPTDTVVDSPTDTPLPVDTDPVQCPDRSDSRNLYWGDLHVHTSRSFDAWGVGATRNTPTDAYAYAKGEPLGLPWNTTPDEALQAAAPLDFAAVTDHAEFLGELALCIRPGSGVYWSQTCIAWRLDPEAQFRPWSAGLLAQPTQRLPICNTTDCLERASDVWARTQQATEEADDPCTFTALHGYEWTGVGPFGVGIHRNILFADSQVPSLPISAFEASTATDMLFSHADACETDGCRFVSIPHNSNLSRGLMFPESMTREEGALRAAHEPLVEITQVKGVGECDPNLAGAGLEDEACDFGLRDPVCAPGQTERCLPACDPGESGDCVHVTDYLRGTLAAGLQRSTEWGFNPLEVGVIGSTDTHNGMPGSTTSRDYRGHHGRIEASLRGLVARPDVEARNNPGGLAAVWATENTREALFSALQRRETYATSGTRIALRFFAGDLDAQACERPDLVEHARTEGVPMGSVWEGDAPTFVAWASRAPDGSLADGTALPGAPLHRVQIVKVWADADGSHEAVFDLAGTDSRAEVDPDTCEVPPGTGELCGTWTDPDFRADQHAAYYIRVFEQPTCRWSTWVCRHRYTRGVDYQCAEDGLPEGEREPAGCCDADVPLTVQQRAWSSPIFTGPR